MSLQNMPKIKLSNTQALVILYSGTGTENGRIAYNFGRSTRATFRKLHNLGLIDCPSAGALLTPWGTHVWACLSSEPTRRTFSIGEIEPVVTEPEIQEDAGFHETGYPETGVAPKEYAVTVIRIHGDEHVHRTGCRDILISKKRAGIWSDDPLDMTVSSRLDVAENYWGDVSTDAGPEGSPEWWEALEYNHSGMKYHNCIRELPMGNWPITTV